MIVKQTFNIRHAHAATRRTPGAFIILCALCLLSACASVPKTNDRAKLTPEQFAATTWDDVLSRARGTTVNFAMYAGDEQRNRFFQERVAATLKEKYDITLRLTPLNDTVEVVNRLLNEKSAGKMRGGAVDMIWINGENFRTAKQARVLWGAFADSLPNIKYYEAAARQRDFGTAIDGYEAPWQQAQFVLAYDTARTPSPPRSVEALREWIKSHPGRFTYIAPPDFTGSVFLRHILYHFGGDDARQFENNFDEKLYREASAPTIEYLNDIKPYLWRQGATYPATTRELDRLFVNNEVDFVFAYGASFASEKIRRGEYPPTVRTFLFDEGTIGNYNFLAVPFNSGNTAGALVVINHLMSPAHLLEQTRALGGVFPLLLAALSDEERRRVESLPRGEATLPLEVLAAHRLPEADAEYLERLEKDWEAQVLRR